MSGLTLKHGAWRAQVLPEAGGLMTRLDHADSPVLRGLSDGPVSPLRAACFPMVPWCNRIAEGRFHWAEADVCLAPNFLPERHAIHGHGWQSAWTVETQSDAALTIEHRHDGAAPGWPWAYAARQTIALTETGCEVTLSLTNLSGHLMPAGIGLHPYLRRRPESRVAFIAESVIEMSPDMIPTGARLAPAQFADFSAPGGTVLPARTGIDHCFTGWNGIAMVSDDCGTITLAAEGAGALHLYAPEDAEILCLEPVNHLPDAINNGTMPLAEPDETLSLTLRIGIA